MDQPPGDFCNRCSDTRTKERPTKEDITDVAEATAFWRMLWQTEGTGSVLSEWLHKVRDALREKLSEPPEEAFEPCVKQVERTILKKRNWITPGSNRIANFWWKRVNCLHSGIAKSFQAIALEDQDIPLWFTGGKTSLIPKLGDFSIENHRPITCLNYHL